VIAQTVQALEGSPLALEGSPFALLKCTLVQSQYRKPQDVQSALELVRSLAAGGGAGALGRGGVPAAVIAALSERELQIHVQDIGWSAVSELLLDKENAVLLGQARACEALETCLHTHSESMGLLKVPHKGIQHICIPLARKTLPFARRELIECIRASARAYRCSAQQWPALQ
jgi:hypothetical protein